jgi:8-oxo-dGTP diphosphatase
MTTKPFHLSVKVVIRDAQGRLLVLQRSHQSKGNPGKWEFPGGKIDPGETFDAALLREVSEETGLTITLERVVGCAQSDLPGKTIVYLFFEARLEAGEVRVSEEHDAFAWVELPALPNVDLSPQFVEFAKSYALAGSREQQP